MSNIAVIFERPELTSPAPCSPHNAGVSDLNALSSTLALQHRRLLDMVEKIERIVAGPPPGKVDELAPLRWQFTRELLMHFAYVQTRVIDPLLSDQRLNVARYAARSSTDILLVYEQFVRHATRWQGRVPGEHWDEYTRAIALLMRRTRVRLAAEQSELYPALPVQPGGARVALAVQPLDYAAEMWKTRARLDAVAQRQAA
jgi:hypothetical protein